MNNQFLSSLGIDPNMDPKSILDGLEEIQFEYLERSENVSDTERKKEIEELLKAIDTEIKQVKEDLSTVRTSVILDSDDVAQESTGTDDNRNDARKQEGKEKDKDKAEKRSSQIPDKRETDNGKKTGTVQEGKEGCGKEDRKGIVQESKEVSDKVEQIKRKDAERKEREQKKKSKDTNKADPGMQVDSQTQGASGNTSSHTGSQQTDSTAPKVKDVSSTGKRGDTFLTTGNTSVASNGRTWYEIYLDDNKQKLGWANETVLEIIK